MSKLTIAVTQMTCSDNEDKNVRKAEKMIRQASSQGAQIILLQELFAISYFCIDQDPKYFSLAQEAESHPMLEHMSTLAKELSVVLPVSFFEKANRVYFNSVIVIDADGKRLGIYRKSHIPHDPGYWEKFYFAPGDTGFKVWKTRYANIGVGICWDQWFPECARDMVLKGADVLFYPTAIGCDPNDPTYGSVKRWRRVQQGHAAANVVPICASNRVGTETGGTCDITFYGSSFIANQFGEILIQAGKKEETVLTAIIETDGKSKAAQNYLFRDRRPNLYRNLVSMDGRSLAKNHTQ